MAEHPLDSIPITGVVGDIYLLHSWPSYMLLVAWDGEGTMEVFRCPRINVNPNQVVEDQRNEMTELEAPKEMRDGEDQHFFEIPEKSR